VRDTCAIETTGCPTVTLTESCDGADLGTASTCVARGYGSGTLKCSSACWIDLSGCQVCGDSPIISQCGVEPFTAAPQAVAMAADGTNVGVAWMEIDACNRISLDFARLSPAFALLGTTRLEPPAPAEADSRIVHVGVAALPSGWAVVAYVAPDLFVHAVDASGKDLGRTIISRPPAVDLSSSLRVAARPNGGPLVLWRTSDGLRTSVVAADGRSATAPMDLPVATTLGDYASAAFVGDAFYVVVSTHTAANSAQLYLQRVETDGRPTTTVTALPGVEAWVPTLVSGAGEPRVIYGGPLSGDPSGADWGIKLQKLALTGEAASPPVVFGPGFTGGTPAFARGGDTVALLHGDFGRSLSVARLGADGTIITAPTRIMGLPEGSIWSDVMPGMVGLGSDAVVGWFKFKGIEMARAAP
jgi:hypothetical protein